MNTPTQIARSLKAHDELHSTDAVDSLDFIVRDGFCPENLLDSIDVDVLVRFELVTVEDDLVYSTELGCFVDSEMIHLVETVDFKIERVNETFRRYTFDDGRQFSAVDHEANAWLAHDQQVQLSFDIDYMGGTARRDWADELAAWHDGAASNGCRRFSSFADAEAYLSTLA